MRHKEVIVHWMRMCVIQIKSYIKSTSLWELKSLRVCHSSTNPDVFHASVDHIIIIRPYYLLIRQGPLCRHVCKPAGGPFAQPREKWRKRGAGINWFLYFTIFWFLTHWSDPLPYRHTNSTFYIQIRICLNSILNEHPLSKFFCTRYFTSL